VNSPRIHLAVLLLLAATLQAQAPQAHPQQPSLPNHTFTDPTYKISFVYPATWHFSQTDGELSTFHYDARTAPPRAALRAVIAMPENPFPASTFSGAYVYFSVSPHSTAASCAAQAAAPSDKKTHKLPAKPTSIQINDIGFTHGHDEVKDICITQHDEVYTTEHQSACYRFDLAVNNFCGGDVSSVKDITPTQLDQIRSRLGAILSTIHFGSQ
jgi:hypothetical protein